MNVLIYDGPGASQLALTGAKSSLTALLSPYYSVRTISPDALIAEPWTSSTALLVVPGGRDLPYCTALDGAGTRKIDEYLRRGGRYLGFCAGAYFASKRVEFQVGTAMEVSGSRELALFPGIARGTAFPGFVYDSEQGARVVKVAVKEADILEAAMAQLNLKNQSTSITVNDEEINELDTTELEIYWNGGGIFVDAARTAGVKVLATYQEDLQVNGGSAAVVSIRHSKGRVVLSGVHPELSTRKLGSGRRTSTSKPESTKGLNPSVSSFVPVAEKQAAQKHEIYLQKMRSASSVSIQSAEAVNRSRSTSPVSGRSSPKAPKQLDPTVRSFQPEVDANINAAAQTRDRMTLLRLMLQDLGLKTNDKLEKTPELSTMHLLNYMDRSRNSIIETFKSLTTTHVNNIPLIKSNTDTFAIITSEKQRPAPIEGEDIPIDEQVKFICVDRHPPQFPLFDASNFFRLLHRLHYSSQPTGKTYVEPSFGTTLLYGETLTSTQSLLDKNFNFQRQLPSGFTILCSHQLAGRGRGQNSWISPAGVLSFSSILHHTPSSGEAAGSIVLIQYLVSLAVAEAILALRPKLKVKIKWPNDIYLQVPEDIETTGSTFRVARRRYAKISGSLITSSWFNGKYIMTLGIGVNVSNPQPTISINGMLAPENAVSMGELFANILVTFSNHYDRFLAVGSKFDHEFERRYYALWLHDSQVVKLEATQETGVIEGINPKDGTLRVSTPSGEIGLQADGNSFDMMKGLLKVKI